MFNLAKEKPYQAVIISMQLTDKNEEEHVNGFSEMINAMYPESQILKELIRKYSSVFPSDDDPPQESHHFSVTSFNCSPCLSPGNLIPYQPASMKK